MSLLFPFFLAGLAGISLPIVFHMIRRTPSGRQAFSSLMFLRTSPPRLVRRKRLDQLALLCLRALVLGLIALAFARPYLRGESRIDASDSRAQRVALLVDTSASMRREGLFAEALRQAREVRDGLPPESQVTLFGFDQGVHPVASLEELVPGWFATDLGQALVDVAERLQVGRTENEAPATIVLLSDLQQGSDLSELEDYDWPSDVELDLRRIEGAPGNAGLHPGPRVRPGEGDSGGPRRVRVSSAADTSESRFTLRWEDAAGSTLGDEVAIFCSPGESRVVTAPSRADRATGSETLALVLSGDGVPFDNVLHESVASPRELQVVSLAGAEPDPGDGGEHSLDFFLENVFDGEPAGLDARGQTPPPALDPMRQPLLIARLGAGRRPDLATLTDHARRGGVVLLVLAASADGSARQADLRELLAVPNLALGEADARGDFTLLSEIDFAHPLFEPFADPRYSDFTKIRFWRHRSLDLGDGEGLRVLARFDDGTPYLVERELGRGTILVASASWESEDSDLARSSKFAPLLQGMLRLEAVPDLAFESFLVGDAIPLGPSEGVARELRFPDGSRLSLEAEATVFTGTTQPGPYQLTAGALVRPFSVQLDPRESRTEPLDTDPLERVGVALVAEQTPESEALRDENERQELGFEIEGRQKLWRWLLVAAVAGLLVETTWAGRLARRQGTEES